MKFELKSPIFKENGEIPRKYTAEGENHSPPLFWSGVPERTKSFALIVEDPDAPAGTWIHWVLYDIPPDARALQEGVLRLEQLPNGAKQGLAGGVTLGADLGYDGPFPPPGKAHRYVFTLQALDKALNLPPRRSHRELLRAMEGHVLARAQTTALYARI